MFLVEAKFRCSVEKFFYDKQGKGSDNKSHLSTYNKVDK